MNLIKRCYAFKCLFAIFLPVCPAFIGRVARYTPSSELNIQPKIEQESFKLILNTYLAKKVKEDIARHELLPSLTFRH